MLGIVVSRADEAAEHVGEQLLALGEWTTVEDDDHPPAAGGGTVHRTAGAELRTFDGLHVELEGAAEPFEAPDLLAFASRHAGDTGPLLTAHHTGNFGPADVGGEPNRLSTAAPGALSAAFEAVDRHAPDGYDVGLECTHHGPTDVDVPSLFVEVGSGEAEWRDPEAAAAVARAILALRGVEPRPDRAFVGFGGGHYVPRFARIVRETDWCVGHVAADWSLDAVGEPDDDLLGRAFERSGAPLAVIDGDRPALAAAIDGLGYRVVGESWLRETTGVPLGFVDRAEAAVSAVDEGLRFGRPARDPPDDFDVVEPPPALLRALNGIDAGQVREAVATEVLAFETVEAGNRVDGRLAVSGPAATARLESAFLDLLGDRYDAVAIEGGEIVVTERAFDPDRARELGVEPGPAFGRLADGEPVTVDGEPIAPEAVHERRTRRFSRLGA